MARRLKQPAPEGVTAAQKPECLVFTIGLSSGDFTSRLDVPIPRTEEEVKKAMMRWMDFMLTGLKISAERMDAVFQVEEDTPHAEAKDGK